MTTLILHHYPQSPVTEKVRIALGIKNLTWQSVEIPRLPPRPLLMPMTGGYRRTPVLQIGSDIYCDSQCILRELDTRFPEPSLFPEPLCEMAWAISRWIDGPVFTSAIAVVLGSAEDLPADFAADRGRLYFGEQFKLEQLRQEVSHHISQLYAQLHWAEQMLESQHSSGMRFLAGASPGLMDIMLYYIVWFLTGRWSQGEQFVNQLSVVARWQQEMLLIGHGISTEMDAKFALQAARDTQPQTKQTVGACCTTGIAPGMRVSIIPDVGGGDPVVFGEVVLVDVNQIAIVRQDTEVGEVVIHFPRVGYRVTIES